MIKLQHDYYLTLAEVAELCGISRQAVLQRVNRNKLPAMRDRWGLRWRWLVKRGTAERLKRQLGSVKAI